MNRLLHASLLPVVLAALSTVACTAETQGDGAKVDATQSPADLLAGQAGTPTAPVQGYATAQTITSGRATLVVDGTSYDLVSYSFGVSRVAEAGVMREAARPELASLHVVVRRSSHRDRGRMREPRLAADVLAGERGRARDLSSPAGRDATRWGVGRDHEPQRGP